MSNYTDPKNPFYSSKITRLTPYTKTEIEKKVSGLINQRYGSEPININDPYVQFMDNFLSTLEYRQVPSYFCEKIAITIKALISANPQRYSKEAVKSLAIMFDITEILSVYYTETPYRHL